MKKFLLIILVLSVSFSLMAQKTKIKEAGLVFSNLNNFGATYKVGTETSLWRFNALNLSGANTKQIYDDYTYFYKNIDFGLSIGKEFRHSFANKLEFRYGADVSFSYSHSNDLDDYDLPEDDETTESNTYIPGVNLVIGLNYVLSKNFVIGAELLPNVRYSIGKEKNLYEGEETTREISRFIYGLSSSSVQFTVAYRFSK